MLSEVEALLYIYNKEQFPAIRSNLLCRTPAQKDFHFYRGCENLLKKEILGSTR